MERLLLTLLVVAVFLLAVYGMWRGWRRKAREQSAQYGPFPPIPDELGPELAVTEGLYVATTASGRWQERIVTRGVGLRGKATLRRHERGIVVDRAPAASFLIPAESIVDIQTGQKMAGKVMGTDGLLVITWRLGDQLLDTGFRGDDVDVYPEWIKIGGAA